MKITENFDRFEFDCHDGTPYPELWIESKLKVLCEQLEVVRAEIKNPLMVLSGYRTESWNKRIGGASKSNHMEGIAADITCRDISAKQLHDTFLALIENKKILDGGLGLYKTFVHYDIRKTPARWVG